MAVITAFTTNHTAPSIFFFEAQLPMLRQCISTCQALVCAMRCPRHAAYIASLQLGTIRCESTVHVVPALQPAQPALQQRAITMALQPQARLQLQYARTLTFN